MNQFEGFAECSAACTVCEAMLPEAVDGMLSESEQSAFEKHVAGCVECARELAEAKRGAAWLSMLKSQTPEPPAGLLAKILAETTGAVQQHASTVAAPTVLVPAQRPVFPVMAEQRKGFGGPLLALRKLWDGWLVTESSRAILQPRLAMTAAMAFFSIALTLNLTGVRLRDLRASNFTPSALKRTVADLDASATRRFQNNRAVYQVESRLSELHNDDGTNDSSPAGHR
jgi:anti-sigma factor RsiW